jgi:superfamily I DNA/RNA helicase
MDDAWDMIQPGDLVLSRTNAPLAIVSVELKGRGLPVLTLGNDFGKRLIRLAQKAKTNDIGKALKWLGDHVKCEVGRLRKQDRPEALKVLTDQASTLRELMVGHDRVSDAIAEIEDIYADQIRDDHVTLSTVHRAKGKEADRVFLLDSTFFLDWGDPQQERNVAYVACTRAKNTLVHVTGDFYLLGES